MRVAQVSEYRKRLAEFHKSVVENHDPLIIGLPGGEDVVVMSWTDYENLQETMHVLKDSVTMASLLEGRIRVAARESAGKDPAMIFDDVAPH
jgi:prevent-host-death family protein